MDNIEALASAGFKLFPVKAGAKYPPLVRFKTEATTDLNKLNQWRQRWPDCNWGIHTEGLLVLDVDTHKGGFDSLLESYADLPPTLEVSTPSGGMHLYYMHPPGVMNSVGKLGAGLDVRSNGGYVLAPGSKVPAGEYRVAKNTPPVLPPQSLVDQCGAARQADRTDETPEGVDVEGAVDRAMAWLATAEPAVEGAGGDARTYAVICRVRDFGVPESMALEVLTEWNLLCSPPWDIDDLTRKVVNVYRYAQNEPAALAVEALFDVVEPTQQKAPGMDPEMYTPDDITLGSVLSTDYLIKGWLDRGAQAMVFGHWGSGKTFITLHLAAHLAAGEQWFGNRLRQGGVLFLGYEGEKSMKKRLYALRQEFPEWDLSQFMVRPMRWPLVKKNATAKTTGQQHAEAALASFKAVTGSYPALLVIDPLRNALGGSDSDPDLTAPYLAYLQRLTKATGCTTLTIHHPGHGDSERARGDSGLEAHMDTVIKVDGELGKIESRKQRDDPKGALYYRLKIISLGTDEDGDPRTTCVAEQVQENPLDPGLTDQQNKVLEKLRELAGEDGEVTKTMFRQATRTFSTVVRADIQQALEKKQYLMPDGKGWILGAGAAEMFNEGGD